jgi:Spy/CpxP family protein refolding chaperone
VTLHLGPGARQRLLGIGLLLVTFVVGGFAGASLQQVLSSRTAESDETPRQPRGGEGRSNERGRNDDFPFIRLEVTEEQRPQIERILDEGQKKLNDFWRRNQPVLRATVDSTRAEIRAVLTPEQNMRWDSLRREDRQRSRQRSGGRGPQQR